MRRRSFLNSRALSLKPDVSQEDSADFLFRPNEFLKDLKPPQVADFEADTLDNQYDFLDPKRTISHRLRFQIHNPQSTRVIRLGI